MVMLFAALLRLPPLPTLEVLDSVSVLLPAAVASRLCRQSIDLSLSQQPVKLF